MTLLLWIGLGVLALLGSALFIIWIRRPPRAARGRRGMEAIRPHGSR